MGRWESGSKLPSSKRWRAVCEPVLLWNLFGMRRRARSAASYQAKCER